MDIDAQIEKHEQVIAELKRDREGTMKALTREYADQAPIVVG